MFTSLVGFFLLFCAILVSALAAPAKLLRKEASVTGSGRRCLGAGLHCVWGGLRAPCQYGGLLGASCGRKQQLETQRRGDTVDEGTVHSLTPCLGGSRASSDAPGAPRPAPPSSCLLQTRLP